MISPENTHASNLIQIEYIVLMSIYVYTYLQVIINENEAMNLKESSGLGIGRFERGRVGENLL